MLPSVFAENRYLVKIPHIANFPIFALKQADFVQKQPKNVILSHFWHISGVLLS